MSPSLVQQQRNREHMINKDNTTITQRRRGPSPSVESDSSSIPKELSGRRPNTADYTNTRKSKVPGALSGASGRGLLEDEFRSDYVLQREDCVDLGRSLGDSCLTLMDEVVLLGLKDQQVP